MSKRDDNTEADGRAGDLLDEMSALSQIISGARYPGRAWPVRRKWPARTVLLSLAGAAAAAILIAAAFWPSRTAPPGAGPTEKPSKVASVPPSRTFVLSIPTDIDPTVGARVVIDIPTVTIPSAGEAGGFKWDIPTISFPSSPDRSNNHDS